ncbi:MAG: secondary thiamine-phosphate synthase enzyme YjbQ [Candidatus Caldarchaeum sp.]|nr:secondary thiamine-phosphate synthase enzyme YjbQ [Candidatus Caldarchaeales archaeon]MDJ0272031.1 secondary thiamine-phosphate synthase enzyme YjbQ [Candidatus Caldarchaeales archaeon]
MKVVYDMIVLNTRSRIELHDVSQEVERVVAASGVREGVVNVFSQHTTMALYLNENETNLRRDVLEFLEKLAPQREGYHHDTIDPTANTFSHLRSILLSPVITLPIRDGKVVRGTWQSIIAAEFDGPRTRRLLIQVLGE